MHIHRVGICITYQVDGEGECPSVYDSVCMREGQNEGSSRVGSYKKILAVRLIRRNGGEK